MNMNHFLRYGLIVVWLLATHVYAAVPKIDKEVSPLIVTTSLAYIDDINPTVDQELAGVGIIVAPKGQLVADMEGAQFLLDYAADISRYKLSDSPLLLDEKQDFDSFKMRVLSRFFIGEAWHIDAQFQHKNETQRFGEGISQLRADVLVADQAKQTDAELTLVYGRDTDSRFVAVNIFSSKVNYEDNNDYAQFFDITERGIKLDVAFRRSESSSFLVRLEATEENYALGSRDDGEVYQALLGVDWQPSGKTKLEALIGMYSRESGADESNSGLSWAVDFSTEPSSQWLWEVKSARFTGISKSELTSSSIEQNVKMAVTYLLSERWQIGANVSTTNVEFNDDGFSSTLEESKAELNLALSLKKHNKVMLSMGVNQQTYPEALVDFSQHEVRLSWQVSL